MTSPAPAPNPTQLNEFNISAPVFVAQTPYADVWKVTRNDVSFAALKTYKRAMDNEGTGFDMLRHWNGIGAAQLYARTDTAALIEWLDGPSLGDIVRGGDDDGPTRALVEVANLLHASAPRPDFPLDTLDDWFADLLATTCTPDCPQSTKATLHRAKSMARELLQDPAPQRALHGDLHHDNIIRSPRGDIAFDAKGVIGNRHYEFASAFRNPLGAEDHVMRPETVIRRAQVWAAAFGTTPKTLLSWAAAHSALSLSWTHKGVFGPDQTKDLRFIDTLFTCRDTIS